MYFLEPGQIFAILCVFAIIFASAWIYFRWTIVMCDSPADLSGKTAIVTGANSGIGYFTALDFAKRKARVILACRNKERAEKAKEKIIALTGNKNVVVRIVDLSILRSVRDFAELIKSEESRLDILVNNAGIVSTGKAREVTDEGLEIIFAANYFGPFLLTNLLLDLMKKSQPSRIVNVSSVIHKWGTIDFENLQGEKYFHHSYQYANSKLALNLFTRDLAKSLEGTDVTANVLHPGPVSTELLNRMNIFIKYPVQLFVRLCCRTAEEGAQTSIYLAVSDEVKDIRGKYFVDSEIQEVTHPTFQDMNLAKKLWDVSSDLTGLTKAD